MSEKMYPIPFKSLMNWVVTEYAREGEIFGVHAPYYASGKTLPIFGETIETPFGPAAGPNSHRSFNHNFHWKHLLYIEVLKILVLIVTQIPADFNQILGFEATVFMV